MFPEILDYLIFLYELFVGMPLVMSLINSRAENLGGEKLI
jgi:hypothetical protein